jgi:hypothetical protein
MPVPFSPIKNITYKIKILLVKVGLLLGSQMFSAVQKECQFRRRRGEIMWNGENYRTWSLAVCSVYTSLCVCNQMLRQTNYME